MINNKKPRTEPVKPSALVWCLMHGAESPVFRRMGQKTETATWTLKKFYFLLRFWKVLWMAQHRRTMTQIGKQVYYFYLGEQLTRSQTQWGEDRNTSSGKALEKSSQVGSTVFWDRMLSQDSGWPLPAKYSWQIDILFMFIYPVSFEYWGWKFPCCFSSHQSWEARPSIIFIIQL